MCRAFAKKCSKCSQLGHFVRCCKSKKEIKEVSKEPAENNEVANFLGIPEVVLLPLEVMVESVILQRGKTFPLALPCTARQHQRLDEEI